MAPNRRRIIWRRKICSSSRFCWMRPEYSVRAEALLRAGSRVLETQSFAAPVLLAALDLRERGVMKFQVPAPRLVRCYEKLRTGYYPRAVFTQGEGPGVTVCEGATCRRFE